ncbi:MAG: glutamine--fructose-6-phosphate aminotransferase, partial [Desulfobacterales bacterium]
MKRLNRCGFNVVPRRWAQIIKTLARWGHLPVCFGRRRDSAPQGALILFPFCPTRLNCGLAGIVALNRPRPDEQPAALERLEALLDTCQANGLETCRKSGAVLAETYLGGDAHVRLLQETADRLKQKPHFFALFDQPGKRKHLQALAKRLGALIAEERRVVAAIEGHLQAADVECIHAHLETLQDVAWCMDRELLANIAKIEALMDSARNEANPQTVEVFTNINTVLNSIDHLEVRGRDSAGMSLMFLLDEPEFRRFEATLKRDLPEAHDHMARRAQTSILGNRGLDIYAATDAEGNTAVTISLVYKVAAEIGSLGDNIKFIRNEIRSDPVLQTLVGFRRRHHTVSSHTRWASVGAINEANCHPLDARTTCYPQCARGPMHVCLNGDIDNFMTLKAAFETGGDQIQEEISTDTKIIPLQINHYLNEGCEPAEAFRRAVNDFEGSHAISMHTALAPGKLFLAQKGSGQAIFIGLAQDHYMPTSEVYGFIEQTQRYLKMDGEKIVDGRKGPTQGQIFILDQNAEGGLKGIQAMYYDGTPIDLKPEDIKQTDLTSRDINRREFPHYFLKEISEAPDSVAKTLYNRWKIKDRSKDLWAIDFDDTVMPPNLRRAIAEDRIRRIYFVGQGTAGVAAQACANLLSYYLN